MMVLTADIKYGIHIVAFVSWVVIFEFICGAIPYGDTLKAPITDPISRYGLPATVFLYLLRFASLLVLPQCICNMFGLLLFNGFKEKVQLKASPLLAPFVCFRVVTRGDYPDLVKDNVEKNIQTCYEAGIENFIFEVVTDTDIYLPTRPKLRDAIVVPKEYTTSTSAMFKARALQYCLEDKVNILQNDDWVVHLDEETLLSVNAVCGILNFCVDGQHNFGQGVITYANGEIVNWITTLSDSFRVADDMGKLRFQFSYFHKPLFGWKGSYVVTRAGAERAVSFDHGPAGSVAEDCYFSMIAYKQGYTFDFIEGEMHEKSPFTFWDFLQQRKRWLQGIYLTVHAKQIPIKNKLFLGLSLYAWATMPLTSLQIFLCPMFPLPQCFIVDFFVGFVGAVNLYMYIFGVVKSFSHKCRHNSWHLLFYITGALFTIPFNICIENIAVLLGLVGNKYNFYVVDKVIQRQNNAMTTQISSKNVPMIV